MTTQDTQDTQRLYQLPVKINVIPGDIILGADSTQSFNEVQISLQNLFNNIYFANIKNCLVGFNNTYLNGTVSQSGTIITGLNTLFSTLGVKTGLILFNSGQTAVVTNIINNTTLYADVSQTVSSTGYTFYYNGFNLDNLGNGSMMNVVLNNNARVKTITTNTTVSVNDYFLLANATSSPITINLILSAQISGKRYIFKKIDSSINTVVITANGSDLIDGSPIYTLSSQYDSVEIVSDGGINWIIV